MHHLKIYKRIFYNSDCYKQDTIQHQRGVQVHSTGANNPWLRRYVGPDDGRLGVNQYGNHSNKPGSTVCASAYIGKQADGTVAVYQTLPWDMRCWLSGSGKNGNANKLGYAGFEICEDGLQDEGYFLAAMEQAILLTAHLCKLFGMVPTAVVKETPEGPALAVMDHAELHRVGLASNHGDISHWFKKFGWNMDNFRDRVTGAMIEGVVVEYIDCDEGDDIVIMRRGSAGEAVRALQELLKKCGYDCGDIDGMFGSKTEAAVKNFQRDHGLIVDGIAGEKTQEALAAAAAVDDGRITTTRNELAGIRANAYEIIQRIDGLMAGGDALE